MFETDVLQNIDHCEIVAGGTNHLARLSEGFGTFEGGETVEGSLQSRIKDTIELLLVPLHILFLAAEVLKVLTKSWVWFMILYGSNEVP